VLFIFSGCGQTEELALNAPENGVEVTLPRQITSANFNTVDLWGLQFDFGVPAVDDNHTIRTKEAPGKLLGYSFHIDDLNKQPDGLGDFTISEKIHDELVADEAPCDVLKTKTDENMNDLYLPMYVDKPFLCSSEHQGDMLILSIIGRGYQFENLPYVDGAMFVLRPHDVIIVSGMIPEDQRAVIDSKYRDQFSKQLENIDFPGSGWMVVNDKMEVVISDLVKNEDPDLVVALKYIEGIAGSVKESTRPE